MNWTTKLESVIFKSLGFKNDLAISNSDFEVDFWRFDHIDEKEFLEKAETGDLLLFRGRHVGAKITRTWTNGEVDHAAMIIRLEKYNSQIFLLESVMVNGVGFTSWEFFKANNSIYKQVFYRKLNCNRNNQFYDKFD